ncbi:type VI secretion system tube protein Hcp [Xenorhabdus sp. Sc-CR9]|uniref:type VI secretion system tube protein Hcp n=1 Tax=Xenorhabdus sp. Sc-CR9 TaxID=2584468 RepID=UPI001F202E72|nr:type VI secretion system tube protein Hcp [Xenorhabdus sp. Sc-CR9]
MSSTGIDSFISFTDIQGEATATSYENQTAVRSFSLELSNRVNYEPQVSGLGGGIVQVSGLSLEILFDKSAISLRKFIVKGQHIDKSTLIVLRQGGERAAWYTLTMTKVFVAQSQLTFGGGYFYSALSLVFNSYKEEYSSQAGDGKSSPAVKYGWDATTGKVT